MQLQNPGQSSSGPGARRNRIALGLLTVALLCATAAASAQSIYKVPNGADPARYTDRPEVAERAGVATGAALAVQTRQESPAARTDPGSGITGRGPHSSSRSRKIDQDEASRRLLQARRALARGPDVRHGEPPSAEKVPGALRSARLLKLRRNVDAAEARMREVYAQGYAADHVSPATPAPMVVATGDDNVRARRETGQPYSR